MTLWTILSRARLGLSGGLVDREGFPINDVEKIVATTTARNELSSM